MTDGGLLHGDLVGELPVFNLQHLDVFVSALAEGGLCLAVTLFPLGFAGVHLQRERERERERVRLEYDMIEDDSIDDVPAYGRPCV